VGIVFKGSGFYSTDNRKTSSLGVAGSNSKDTNGKDKSEHTDGAKATTEKAASTQTEK